MLKWSVRNGKQLVARFSEERDARGFAKARYGDKAIVEGDIVPATSDSHRLYRRVVDDYVVTVSAPIKGSNGEMYVNVTDRWGNYHMRESALSSKDYEPQSADAVARVADDQHEPTPRE